MKIRFALGSLALSLASPYCAASVLCADLDPSSLQYSSKLSSVGQEAGIPVGRFSQYHRQAVLSLCAGREDRVEDLVDQGQVSAREVGAIKRVLVLGDSVATPSPSVARTQGTRPQVNTNAEKTVVRKPSADEAAGIDRAVDLLFARWSQNWFTDRYVRGSAHGLELTAKSDEYLVKGTFSFTRYGSTATIPFASTLKRIGEFAVTNLCYNDTTSGMTDCTSSGQSSASSRMMGAIIVGGIVAGIGNSTAAAETKQKSCYTTADYGEPGMLGYQENADGVGNAGIPRQACY